MLLCDNDGAVAVCHNLRPAPGCQGLEPIPATERAAACRLHVFCEFGADGLSFVAADGKDLSIFYPQRATNVVRFIGSVPDTPLDVHVIDNVVAVTTEKGDYYLDYDPATDLFSHRGYDAALPAVSIEAAEAAVVSVTVPATNLSKAASPGRSLTKADAARLSADLVNGYASLLQSAEFSGGQLQPNVGFYRLLDADNNEIYRSAPTLVSLPAGVQLTGSVRLKATDTTFSSVESYRLEASVMKMRVNIDAPTGREGDRAARLEVWVSPQLHPFDPSRRFGLVLSEEDCVRLAEPRNAVGMHAVAWRATARFHRAVVPTHVKVDAAAVEMDAAAVEMDAAVDVAHGHIAGEEASVASFALQGRIGAPLCRRVMCRAVESLAVGFHGTVSPDFLFHAPEIVSCANGKQTRHRFLA